MRTSIPIQRNAKLIVIKSETFDVYRNFKTEEEILKICDNNNFVLRFWKNNPCVVIGKFQNIEYEVNLEFVRKRGIPIIRRFTGGGTVYHDRGTLNVSFCKDKNFYMFSKYFIEEGKGITEIILKAIRSFGIDAYMEKRNSIFVDGKKVLGSAMAVKNNKLFYHASILVNGDLKMLKKVIKWKEDYPRGTKNVVKSVRSEVANLKDFKKIKIEELEEKILEIFFNYFKIIYKQKQLGGKERHD